MRALLDDPRRKSAANPSTPDLVQPLLRCGRCSGGRMDKRDLSARDWGLVAAAIA